MSTQPEISPEQTAVEEDLVGRGGEAHAGVDGEVGEARGERERGCGEAAVEGERGGL